ncbi:MAG: efflux RND transporter periplasmic adaptor subunit, partial [Planctomycetes bacterium]|nr:efflux RND transporter periplasmic adaptor subunit [Planctomycetota bacterium]
MPETMTPVKETRMLVSLPKWLKSAGLIVIVLTVLGGTVLVMGGGRAPWGSQEEEKSAAPAKPPPLAVELVKGQPHTLFVPPEVRTSLGIRKGGVDTMAVAREPTQSPGPIVLPGSTALDSTRLLRLRVRFAPAEVVAIGQVPEYTSGQTVFRELRSGDKVRMGEILAVLYSADVGNKKNDLIDAIVQLRLDEAILKRSEAGAASVPEVFLLNARRNVEGDQNAITRAVNTLKTWDIPEADIQAARDEAEQISKRNGERDKNKEDQWARVELKAPEDGVIIERNVSLHEMVVDNTVNLFQIARVDRLTVLANVSEDDLPALQRLPTEQRRWTVRTAGAPPLPGLIDDIGYLIDPNQHTAVVMGHIDNPNGVLRGGQFITATVAMPPPPDVVEIPITAVVEDGKQSLVFVQPDAEKPNYTMRRVQVSHRFDRTAYVRSSPIPKDQQRTPEEEEQGLLPKESLRPGERVLTSGVLELKAALLDKESQPEG